MSELKKNNIEPIATLYHYDLPSALQKYGGWKNDSTIQRFEEYARLMFKELGNTVRYSVSKVFVMAFGVGCLFSDVSL